MADKTTPRKIEVVISKTTKSIKKNKGTGVVCDALFQVLVYREPQELLMDIMSVDGETLKPMPFKDLYQMWVATTGYLLRLPVEEDPEVLKIKRFLLITLNRMLLDSNLRRLEVLKAENPDVPEKELVKLVISEGVVPQE
jgi:hypothetical protein